MSEIRVRSTVVKLFLRELSMLLDLGITLSVENVHTAIFNGKLIQLLDSHYRSFDYDRVFMIPDSTFPSDSGEIINIVFNRLLVGFTVDNACNEWGVENNGLCLLVALCGDLMQDFLIGE